MLEKIYTACELEAEVETTTITCDPPQNIASNVHSHGADLHVAIFGLSPKQIGALWTVSPYQWINVGQQTWCFAERLEIIEADLEKKKQLWSCLKILKPS